MDKIALLPDANSSCDGIITKFNNIYGDDFKKFVIIKPSTTSSYPGRVEADALINRSITGNEIKDNWCSSDAENSSLLLTFLRHKVKPNYYTLESKSNGGSYPYSWIVEASNNLQRWDLIDTKSQSNLLLAVGMIHTFKLNTIKKYKYFRITQLEGLISNDHSNLFCLRRIELFGDVISNEAITNCISTRKNTLTNIMLFVLISAH